MSVNDYKGNGGSPKHRLHGKYRGFDRRAVRCFIWMQDRVKRKTGRVCKFPRTREGMEAFMNEMGPIPEGLKKPSVGRKDHAKGYEPGNVKWEPWFFNSWKGRRDEADAIAKLDSEKTPEAFRWAKQIRDDDWDLG